MVAPSLPNSANALHNVALTRTQPRGVIYGETTPLPSDSFIGFKKASSRFGRIQTGSRAKMRFVLSTYCVNYHNMFLVR